MQFELKSLKIARSLSQETLAFTATLVIDGRAAAAVRNEGQGGPTAVHFVDKAQEAAFLGYLQSLPAEDGLAMDVDIFIARLVDEAETRRLLRTASRTKTLFRLRDERYGLGEYRTVKAPYSPAVHAWLEARYGSRLGEVIRPGF